MKICFINPPINQHNAPIDFPVQFLILGAVARQTGWEPHIIDFNFLTKSNPRFPLSNRFFDPAIELIRSYDPNLIGISCLSSSLPFALEIARRYKNKYDEPIVFGGPQATLLHDHIMGRYPFIDIICRGEGEITLKHLLCSYDDISGVAGISYRTSGGEIVINPARPFAENLDRLPAPAYDLINIDEYKRLRPNIPLNIEAGRGCPYACAYCSTSLVWGRKFRLKSISRLLDEIKHATASTNIYDIHFIHDLFSLNSDWVFELCGALNTLNNKIKWGCDTRVDAVTPEMLRKMADSGCKSIFYGIESGSRRIQKEMKKNIDLDESVEMISETIGRGIRTTASFIIGYPGETFDELNETFEHMLLLMMLNLSGIVINIFIPEYGTQSHEICKNQLASVSYMMKKDLPFLNQDIVGLIENDPVAFSHFYYPQNQDYDYEILLKLFRILSVSTHFKVFKHISFYLSEKKSLDIHLELYDFIKDSFRFDEYDNIRYVPMNLHKGILNYFNFLNKKYALTISHLPDESMIKNLVRELHK